MSHVIYSGVMSIFRNKHAPVFIAAAILSSTIAPGALSQTVDHVIHISVDGLRPDAVLALGPVHCPNFHRLMIEGAFTLNARSDCDYTNTLPNHTCQMTGRAALGPEGHGVSFNSDTGGTIADAHGSYAAGIFDAAHDNGLVTALYAGKDKFALYDRSWDAVNGAPDITGEDNGRDKIDHYMFLGNTTELVDSFLTLLDSSLPGFFFLHLRDPDTDGHAYGWKSPEYLDSIIRMDAAIGRVLDAIETNPSFAGRAAIIVMADHGGTGTSHSDADDPLNYTIPFFVWGPDIPAGADIYLLNPGSRLDPAAVQLPCDTSIPPIRNGEAANLALSILNLPPVPGSTIGPAPGLTLTAPGPLPSVTVTSPSDGSEYGPDETILIEAEAVSGAGISKVEFFAGWIKIGEDTTAPFELTWNELPLGIHDIAARAMDNNGYAVTDLISVEVVWVTSTEETDLNRWDRPRVYPNPTGASPHLYMHIPVPGPLEILLFDAAGRIAGRQNIRSLPSGSQVIEIDMRGYPSGVYFFRAVSGEYIQSGKFVLIR